MINGLDLFSGYGGITLALGEWVRPIVYCEIERYAQGILLSRMASGDLPTAPIWDDVSTFEGHSFRGEIDIIYGGFPCQDISIAGAGKGLEGKRSGLFREIVRLAEEIRPAFLFLENVPAIRTRGLDSVIKELTDAGYDLRWKSLSAAEVGAPHKRERWFLLAHAPGVGNRGKIRDLSCKDAEASASETEYEVAPGESFAAGTDASILADASGRRHGSSEREICAGRDSPFHESWWQAEPNVGRVVNGCLLRVDRIKALGNGVVPAQARQAFKDLMGIK